MARKLIEQIPLDEAVAIAHNILLPEGLNSLQEEILRQSWSGETYEGMAESSGYSIQHVRDVGYKLWKSLSVAMGEKITKNNVQSALGKQWREKNSPGAIASLSKTIAPVAMEEKEEKQEKHRHIIDAPERSLKLPQGPVSLDSPFYVERSPMEELCYSEILKPGALVRLRAPRRMGKTSLMARILNYAATGGYLTVRLNFSQAEGAVMANLDKFLRWFCANVCRQLRLEPKLDDYWDEDLGSKVSCTTYFQAYLLPEIDKPLVLALDEVDRLFEFPEVARDFLPLLRFWHEEVNNIEVWEQLRLVVVHSTEIYIPLKLHQSPFNVGLPVKLPEFTMEQVLDLADRHQLDFTAEEKGDFVSRLMGMVGGHPYLVRLAFYYLKSGEVGGDRLLEEAPTQTGIYSDYLRRHLGNLMSEPQLTNALKEVVNTAESVRLESIICYKLDSMGLVKVNGDDVTPSCELYRLYFREQLGNV